MFASKLRLTNFRNYETLELSLQPGTNLVFGANGQGKTNLVEAVNFFAALSSHRVSSLTPLIKQGKEQAILSLELRHQDREILLEFEINSSGPNRAKLNRSALNRPKEILGYLNSVIFAPEDLDIVKRDPTNRRAFIDQLVVQLSPRMHGVYSDYERVLKQRNTLLKTARAVKGEGLATLSAWDQSLIDYGSEIIAARVGLTERLLPGLVRNYKLIADTNNEPKMFIKSSILGSVIGDSDESDDVEFLETPNREEIEKLFREKLDRLRSKEIERGITLVGPHRDDLVLILGSLPAKGYASHGESWSYALALRLASLDLLKQESNLGDPILILDDVFAELDSTRRVKLSSLVENNEQVLITAAVIEDVPERLRSHKINIVGGELNA
ncbi:MAG: DNA replication/repair protein RecF [Actinomycetota bacterium]